MNLPDELVRAASTHQLPSFLQSKTAAAWIADLARSHPHERWPRHDRNHFSIGDLNRFAATIIDAQRAGDDIEQALADALTPNPFWNTWHHELAPELQAAFRGAGIEDIDEDCIYLIEANWQEAAATNDHSAVRDIFDSHDHCEILFFFNQTRDLEDNLIECHRPWSEPSELAITTELQFALNNIGYTVGEFRAQARNHHEAFSPLPPHRSRRRKLVTWERLSEAIENSCSRTFSFAIYGIVPISDLFTIDLAQPLTLAKSWLATIDPISGTFHDVPVDGPVTLAPGDGHLFSGGQLSWSPDEICGLHRPHYYTSIANTPARH